MKAPLHHALFGGVLATLWATAAWTAHALAPVPWSAAVAWGSCAASAVTFVVFDRIRPLQRGIPPDAVMLAIALGSFLAAWLWGIVPFQAPVTP